MDNIYSKFQPIEQCRWNQSNIDTLFHAGEQNFVNRHFSFSPGISYQQYYFNLCQQPVNMLTGYQRQHRKSIVYQAADGADPQTTDEYTRLIANNVQKEGINEQFSKSCELTCIAGMNLIQPYLDFTGDDPAQGQLKLKIWEYNSFIVDPYFRQPDMSDAQFVWCQEYISKLEAEFRFPGKIDEIRPMMGAPQRYGSFYFLPENYNMARNDLMVLSYIWYKWRRKRKRLYSRKLNQFFDFAKTANLDQILYSIKDMEVVEVESPCWKVCVVLNDQLMFQGNNPLWEGPECPFIPNFWNYEPHITNFDLRSRSLIFPLRSPQFLFNYKIITNNDLTSSTINSGYKRKSGAVANEENLKQVNAGWDIIINEGYEMTDVEKIIPTAVPESDLALAQQMADLIFKVAGIDLESWSGQQDKQSSSLTLLIKQAANLMVFQKFFDQWDHCLKLVGERLLLIALNHWNEAKVGLMIGQEPSPHFYSKIFAKYQIVVEEGLNTATQKNLQAQQLLDINATFGREVFPPSMIVKDMNIQGKAEAVKFLQQQEQQAQQLQQEQTAVQHAFEDAKLKELYTKAVANIAMAKERVGRFDANVGLLEERLSEISKNQSLSTKAKMEALEKMVDAIQRMGELEAKHRLMEIEAINYGETIKEDQEREKAKNSSEGNRFLEQIMGDIQPQQNQQNAQNPPQQM